MYSPFVVGWVAMTFVLVISNYLVRFPVGEWLTWAAFTYPIAFLVTDCVNRWAGIQTARRVVWVSFLFGLPLSFAFIYLADSTAHWWEAARVAIASGLAFGVGQSLDATIFNRLRQSQHWWLPPLLSSSPASIADTFIFFFIAFAGTGIPWQTLALGDFAVKILMAISLLPTYYFFINRLAIAR